MAEPARDDKSVEVARITSRQAIIVAGISAVASASAVYFGRPNAAPASVQKADLGIANLESRPSEADGKLHQAETDLAEARKAATTAENENKMLKQRVLDILGPKEDKINRIRVSLAEMKNDPAINQDHRERLAEIVEDLDKIDDTIMKIVRGD